jgi:hypothetical protein
MKLHPKNWPGALALLLCLAAAAQAAPSLQDKLNAQWDLYGKARAELLRRVQLTGVPLKDRAISRADWEKLLALPADLAFTPQDLADLKASQALRIRKARELAKLDSVIDLDKVRAEKKIAEFCAGVPKGGMLHVHPYGALDRPTAEKLLRELDPVLDLGPVFQDIARSSGNVTLYPDELAWLRKLPAGARFLSLPPADQERFTDFLFLPPGKQPFPRFNGVFEFIDFAVYDSSRQVSHMDEVLDSFARKAVREGVSYVEFTSGTSPKMLARVAETERKTGLVIRMNSSFARSESLEELENDLAKLSSAPPSGYVVGIDFLDNEEKFPALETGQLLYGEVLQRDLAGKLALRRTMHAGEIGDARNPRDAMIMGAERLGHGVNLARDPVALEYAASVREPVEINLSSNLRLTGVRSIAEHPFLDYLRLGLPVSLSTDDEGIFEMDIDRDCELAVGGTDLTYAEFKRMAFNSIETSFAAEADKKALLAGLTARFAEFEKSAAY